MYPEGFQWDEDKEKSNIKKHGISFNDAASIFDDNKLTLDRIDDRRDYGEVRYNTLGRMDNGACINVTHAERDGDIRIISARYSCQKEKELYLKLVRKYDVEPERDKKTEGHTAEATLQSKPQQLDAAIPEGQQKQEPRTLRPKAKLERPEQRQESPVMEKYRATMQASQAKLTPEQRGEIERRETLARNAMRHSAERNHEHEQGREIEIPGHSRL